MTFACRVHDVPLDEGRTIMLADRAVICPLHDRRYDLATGAALTAGEGITAHAVEVRGDHVYVALASGMSSIA